VRIDEAEADAIYQASMAPNGMANSRFRSPAGPGEPAAPSSAGGSSRAAIVGTAATLWQARTAIFLTEAQLKRLQLEERRGLVINRQLALGKAFAFARLRDRWLGWPARIGPELAADHACSRCKHPLEPTRLMIAVEPYVRLQLEELAAVRLELGGRHARA
jgi:hypothetical protein